MSRVFKFRCWHTSDYPVPGKRGTMLPHEQLSIDGALDGHQWGNVILMQYTGRKDKNFTEIYEGDIIRTPGGHIVEVKFGKIKYRLANLPEDLSELEITGWIIYNPKLRLKESFDESTVKGEVIGNVYQNPELLP